MQHHYSVLSSLLHSQVHLLQHHNQFLPVHTPKIILSDGLGFLLLPRAPASTGLGHGLPHAGPLFPGCQVEVHFGLKLDSVEVSANHAIAGGVWRRGEQLPVEAKPSKIVFHESQNIILSLCEFRCVLSSRTHDNSIGFGPALAIIVINVEKFEGQSGSLFRLQWGVLSGATVPARH